GTFVFGRRKRRRTTRTELGILEAFFVTNPIPTASDRQRLVDQTGMTHKEVQVWFQNKRQTWRRRFKMGGEAYAWATIANGAALETLVDGEGGRGEGVCGEGGQGEGGRGEGGRGEGGRGEGELVVHGERSEQSVSGERSELLVYSERQSQREKHVITPPHTQPFTHTHTQHPHHQYQYQYQYPATHHPTPALSPQASSPQPVTSPPSPEHSTWNWTPSTFAQPVAAKREEAAYSVEALLSPTSASAGDARPWRPWEQKA
ncbi:hypothetical protein HDU96_004193, partial [Phlyctochytrium bullatum]